VSETSYQSIESLATYIANYALNALPHTINVSVRKPSALPFAAAAGVTIKRHYKPPERQDEQEVYIALGSNLGDQLRTMEKGLEKLESSGVHILDVSALYESEPMYFEQQPQFLNAVCKVVPFFHD
jgi:dihydroneopterin aldolase / 2-amino-4-hydroxy-6-hydroxymethyldihydropteridine diphosphokinase / dihydropteroate synthase